VCPRERCSQRRAPPSARLVKRWRAPPRRALPSTRLVKRCAWVPRTRTMRVGAPQTSAPGDPSGSFSRERRLAPLAGKAQRHHAAPMRSIQRPSHHRMSHTHNAPSQPSLLPAARPLTCLPLPRCVCRVVMSKKVYS
jgi:hypothetical protein